MGIKRNLRRVQRERQRQRQLSFEDLPYAVESAQREGEVPLVCGRCGVEMSEMEGGVSNDEVGIVDLCQHCFDVFYPDLRQHLRDMCPICQGEVE